jgi:predicted aspartyl protease
VSLLLDTGAQVTILSPDVAHRLGVVMPPDAPTLPVAGIGVASAPIVIIPSLQLGDHVVENLPVAVVAWHLFAVLPNKIDGLLGANVMEFFRMTVDRRAKELRREPSQ